LLSSPPYARCAGAAAAVKRERGDCALTDDLQTRTGHNTHGKDRGEAHSMMRVGVVSHTRGEQVALGACTLEASQAGCHAAPLSWRGTHTHREVKAAMSLVR